MILRESARIVRARPPLVIAETRHGFVCASAGVDASNAPEPGTLVLLPLDPDASAARLRGDSGADRAARSRVIVSDSFGRPFRQGTTDVAIGVAGLDALLDLRGTRDRVGYELRSTQRRGRRRDRRRRASSSWARPTASRRSIVRGFDVDGDGAATELVMPPDRDLFR